MKLATGMFAIGYYYEVGVGVKADRNEAIKWYQKVRYDAFSNSYIFTLFQ
jgi:TPR repeat protein